MMNRAIIAGLGLLFTFFLSTQIFADDFIRCDIMQVKFMEITEKKEGLEPTYNKIKAIFGEPYIRYTAGESCQCCWRCKRNDGVIDFVRLDMTKDSPALVTPLAGCKPQ